MDRAGDEVYSVQRRLGEGAYAKIYCIVPRDESKAPAGKVLKVCIHSAIFIIMSRSLF